MKFEEFTTLATQIDACLNSRPIILASSDHKELTALTPGHFLIGGPLCVLPEPILEEPEQYIPLRKRCQHLQKMLCDLWSRWTKEVFSEIQKMNRWLDTNYPLQAGDLVIIKDNLYPPARWLLGRVSDVNPNSDGLVRVPTVKTANSQYERPLAN